MSRQWVVAELLHRASGTVLPPGSEVTTEIVDFMNALSGKLALHHYT